MAFEWLLLCAAGSGVGLALTVRHKKRVARERLFATLADDPDVEVDVGRRIAVITRPPHRRAWIVGSGTSWRLLSTAPRLGARSALKLRRAGVLRRGHSDIRVGDTELDRAFLLSGDDADALRGVFSVDAVRRAALALFALPPVLAVELRSAGGVKVLVEETALDPAASKALVLALAGLTAALEEAADAPPLPESSAGAGVLDGAAAASSGAPVGVPLGEHRLAGKRA